MAKKKRAKKSSRSNETRSPKSNETKGTTATTAKRVKAAKSASAKEDSQAMRAKVTHRKVSVGSWKESEPRQETTGVGASKKRLPTAASSRKKAKPHLLSEGRRRSAVAADSQPGVGTEPAVVVTPTPQFKALSREQKFEKLQLVRSGCLTSAKELSVKLGTDVTLDVVGTEDGTVSVRNPGFQLLQLSVNTVELQSVAVRPGFEDKASCLVQLLCQLGVALSVWTR